MYTILVSLVSSTCLLPRTFTNVHKSCFCMSLAQNIHKRSQTLFLHVSCPQHSQMFTNLISTCRTFTNVHNSCFHMSLAQNIHKCSLILFPHVCCPEHSQMFTDPIFICLLPRHSQMFTNLVSPCLLPRTFTNVH